MERILSISDAARYFCKTFDIKNPNIEHYNKGRHILINRTHYIKFARAEFQKYAYFCKGEERGELGETINSEIVDWLFLKDIENVYFVYPNGIILQGKTHDFLFKGDERMTSNEEYTLSIPVRWLKPVFVPNLQNQNKSQAVLM